MSDVILRYKAVTVKNVQTYYFNIREKLNNELNQPLVFENICAIIRMHSIAPITALVFSLMEITFPMNEAH